LNRPTHRTNIDNTSPYSTQSPITDIYTYLTT